MYVNGAGTGIVITYQAVRLLQVRRLGLSAWGVVAAGTASAAASVRLLIVAPATRPAGTTTLGSALFAPRSSPIWREGRKKV